jgi:hypothetical protein
MFANLRGTLKQKENIDRFIDQIVEKITDLEQAHGMSSKTYKEWQNQRADAHKLSVMAMIPHMTEILVQMNVAFLCTNGRASFITSDAPAFLFNSKLQFQTFVGLD